MKPIVNMHKSKKNSKKVEKSVDKGIKMWYSNIAVALDAAGCTLKNEQCEFLKCN